MTATELTARLTEARKVASDCTATSARMVANGIGHLVPWQTLAMAIHWDCEVARLEAMQATA